jgi:hypothetical protein
MLSWQLFSLTGFLMFTWFAVYLGKQMEIFACYLDIIHVLLLLRYSNMENSNE